jgi:hypothetical protein
MLTNLAGRLRFFQRPCRPREASAQVGLAARAQVMTDYFKPAPSEESAVRGSLDDIIIIPVVFVTLAINKILYVILLILMRLLDYAFPLALQIAWLPAFRRNSFRQYRCYCH